MRPENEKRSSSQDRDSNEGGLRIEIHIRKARWRRAAFWFLLSAVFVLPLLPWQIYTFQIGLDRRMRGPGTPILVRIPDGASAARIAGILTESRLVPSSRIFLAAAKREGVTRRLRSGEFLIPGNRSPREIARYLAANSYSTPHISFPEGSTLSQVIRLMILDNVKGSEQAEALARDQEFLGQLGVQSPSLEGYLQPGFYPYQESATARGLFVRMVRAFQTAGRRIGLDASEQILREQGLSPLSPSEVLALASIIQREAGPDSEKPLVSEVFHNRLLKGRRLQSCATIRYITGDWRNPVKKIDLEANSPYNTYRYWGLPPGPICNPGEASLQAALYPTRGNLMYFVACGDGTSYFSETYEEHLEASRRYLGSQE